MKALDIILIIILLFGAYRGFQKGLVVELFGLLAFILAIFVGVIMMEVGTEFLQKFINGYEKLLPYLAFLLIFILVVLTMKLLAWLLKKGLNLTPLGAVDNLAGAILGILKWSLGISFMFWIFSIFGLDFPSSATSDTFLYPIVASLAPFFLDYVDTIIPFTKEILDLLESPKTALVG